MTIQSGSELVRAARLWLRRYVAMSAADELVMVLWCLHTHCYTLLGRATPYVEITGANGTGKTTLMEACSLLSRGGEILNTLRTLYMCRRIAETSGEITMFIDEAEKLSQGAYGDQRSMLASGYRDGGYHGVSVGKGTIRFSSYCPKMFTATRTMVNVLHNRSIPVWMERGGKVDASLGREWARAEATATELRQSFESLASAWMAPAKAAAAERELAKLIPDYKPKHAAGAAHVLSLEANWLAEEREIEIWTPLFTLARTMGLDDALMNELTAASVDLVSRRGVERRCDVKDADEGARERSYAVRLVQDVRSVIREGETILVARELVERLHAIPAGPWRTYQRAGLTEISLAQLLGVFAVESDVRTISGKGKTRKQARGYLVADVRGVKL